MVFHYAFTAEAQRTAEIRGEKVSKLGHYVGSSYLDNPRLPARIGLRLMRHGDVAEWLKAAVC